MLIQCLCSIRNDFKDLHLAPYGPVPIAVASSLAGLVGYVVAFLSLEGGGVTPYFFSTSRDLPEGHIILRDK